MKPFHFLQHNSLKNNNPAKQKKHLSIMDEARQLHQCCNNQKVSIIEHPSISSLPQH